MILTTQQEVANLNAERKQHLKKADACEAMMRSKLAEVEVLMYFRDHREELSAKEEERPATQMRVA